MVLGLDLHHRRSPTLRLMRCDWYSLETSITVIEVVLVGGHVKLVIDAQRKPGEPVAATGTAEENR